MHADLILDPSHFDNLLDHLADEDLDVGLYFEIKANITKKRLIQLRSFGVTTLNIGIECFDSNVLANIQKGANALQNLCVLKWCMELGFIIHWSFLWGFPDDNDQTLLKQLKILKKINHLPPPLQATQVRLERNSPMHRNPSQYGLINIKPLECYFHTYRMNPQDLLQLARRFDYEFEDGTSISPAVVSAIEEFIANWQKHWKPDQIYYRKGQGFIKIYDQSGERIITLRTWRADLFLAMDSPKTEDYLLKSIRHQGDSCSVNDVRKCLNEFLQLGLIIRDNDSYISVVPRVNFQRLNLLKLLEHRTLTWKHKG